MIDDPTPTRNLIKRYKADRTARWLKRGRTQRRRRIIVSALAAVFALMCTVALLCAVGIEWAPLLWPFACVVGFPLTSAVTVVSGNQSEAPRSELDEFEIARRDRARSSALDLTGCLMMIPVVYLIFGAVLTHGKDEHMAYAGGLMVLTALLIGGFSPEMQLAWSMPDPDGEDMQDAPGGYPSSSTNVG